MASVASQSEAEEKEQMTNDAKLLTAAAELGRDRVLLDPTDAAIVLGDRNH